MLDFVHLECYHSCMIFTNAFIKYMSAIPTKIASAKAHHCVTSPYHIQKDPVITAYESIRSVWHDGVSVKQTCLQYDISRTQYYKIEEQFINFGIAGLFQITQHYTEIPELESLAVILKKARPSLSHIELFRFAQAVPITSSLAQKRTIAKILNSYGLGFSSIESDKQYWAKIQRIVQEIKSKQQKKLKGRDPKTKKVTFFNDSDPQHKELECLRTLYFKPQHKLKDVCTRHNVAITTFYRIVSDYNCYGPWGLFSTQEYGKKESISPELHIKIILERLEHPTISSTQIVEKHKLKCSRFIVNRVIRKWGLSDKTRNPIALNEFKSEKNQAERRKEVPTAYTLLSEKTMLDTFRINRHFDIYCQKMKTRSFNICDPGPFILAPFLNELGIVQAFKIHGPEALRGREITNIALLNVFRILAGYRRICHLNNTRDRSVAFASGIGFYGSSSKYYDDTINFKFHHIYKLKQDLGARAIELNIIEGKEIAFDFHFKEFFGKHPEERGIGKGPNKSGNLVPGFRPHIAWDLSKNVIMQIAYHGGGTRSPRIIREFCKDYIYSLIDPMAVDEIYMDSEYTKESDFHYLQKTTFQNGELYMCLKRNRQINLLIKPALDDSDGWKKCESNKEDEMKTTLIILPRTKLSLNIVIIRRIESKQNIRVFGSTNIELSANELLYKYKFRWLIENGLKDLVYSYFIDEIFSKDPERIDFLFYCIMVARITFEHFLNILDTKYSHKEDGNKITLGSMRNLLFEKRNCTLCIDNQENFVIRFLDINEKDSEAFAVTKRVLESMMETGRNKVLWWGNRGIRIEAVNQFEC